MLAALSLLPLTACDGDGTTTLRVFAAASLTGPFTELGRRFEQEHAGTRVVFSFAGSSTLAAQITAAAPADVFASASTRTMDKVGSEVSDARAFAGNLGEIAVAPGSGVDGLADLADPAVKLALCATAVPCGELADAILAKARVPAKPVTRGLDVKATLAYVTSGSADAAIVYATDVLAAGGAVRGVPIPASLNASTSYEIATVRASGHVDLARAFQDLVLSADGQAALRRAGFQGPGQ